MVKHFCLPTSFHFHSSFNSRFSSSGVACDKCMSPFQHIFFSIFSYIYIYILFHVCKHDSVRAQEIDLSAPYPGSLATKMLHHMPPIKGSIWMVENHFYFHVDYELKLNSIKQMKAFTRWNKIRESYGCCRIKVVRHVWNETMTAFLVLTQLTRKKKTNIEASAKKLKRLTLYQTQLNAINY